jgi:hypothetical protein
MKILKTDDELRIVWGEVYVPNVPDAHGDFMTTDSIRKMAHRFLLKGRAHKVDVNHDNQSTGAGVCESFIARAGDQDFIEGSWVAGVHVPDDVTWAKVKSGEINGFSIEALVRSKTRKVALLIPDSIEGRTLKSDQVDHTHGWVCEITDEGEIVGHTTDDDTGHFHLLQKGTTTEEAAGHRHRWSLLDTLKALEIIQ